MAEKSRSRQGHPVPEAAMQQSVPQQTQASAAAQTNRANSTKQKSQNSDSNSPHLVDNDIPPPTYGESYGEIRGEKNGLGTSAHVTDDGRVDIRINQINRRLSQIFAPALHQQVQSVQESRPPPPPYLPPSLGGEDNTLPPPPLNIVIQVVGSRGDVQPFIALGKVLKETYGHRVRLATHPIFKSFVQENGLEFFSIGGDPSQLIAFMVKNPSLMPSFRSLLSGDIGQRRRDVAGYIQGCWRSCYQAGDGTNAGGTNDELFIPLEHEHGFESAARPFVADCIIANPPSFAHIHCAEKLGIPLHIMFTMPYSPTQAFPHPLANIQSSNADPQLTNYISYTMIELLSWQGLGDIINQFRAKCLGLDPVSLIWAPGMLQRLKIPHTYCWSPALIPKPKDWGPNTSISGFYFLNLATSYVPTSGFQSFLDAGPPPVYIGFGSIVLNNPDAMTALIFEAVKKTRQRVVLSKGWGDIGADTHQVPDNVFMLDNVPHDWLFKHVSCVVHHGGAGTTAAGIAAGRPTVIVPFFGDQSFWGAMVARAGAGPDPIPHKQLTADKLADAINFCLKPESIERATELAGKIAAERGSEMGAQSFHQHLEPDRLRCILAPSRPAAWRLKRTQVRLSTFAACTLANANLLDFNDLKLYRPQEHYTDQGPWDPISGGAAACYRAFSGMVMGVGEVPSETLKPLRKPLGFSRRHLQDSVQTIARKSETVEDEGSPDPGASAGQNLTNVNTQKSLTRDRDLTDFSGLSSITSSTNTNPMSDALQVQLSSSQDNPRQSRIRTWKHSDLHHDHDLLRQTGVHMNKGLGRTIKTLVQAPVEIQVGLTKGFHNFPRLWGDDTVRPQEQISGFKSGVTAAGREFGFGMYDGFTGLITQPWKGAQKEGASGFVKGFGKGLGGFATKPLAGLSGVLGYTLKGLCKEVQNLFGSNVQTYIVASRVSQGYEEWMSSSPTEKQDVIDRWKIVQSHLKKDRSLDVTIQNALEAHRKKNIEISETCSNCGENARFPQNTSIDIPLPERDSAILTTERSQCAEEISSAADINATIRLHCQRALHEDVGENSHVERATQENPTSLRCQQRETVDYEAVQETQHWTITTSENENQQHPTEASEFEKQLEQAIAKSVLEQ